MSLLFDWKQIKNRNKGLTFDDVLIVPAKSEVRSRKDPRLTSQLTKKVQLSLPVISANMDTITEGPMALAMAQLGGLGIIHRFMSIEDQLKEIEILRSAKIPIISASVGVSDDYQARSQALVEAGVNILTIDIAHGHSVQMIDTLQWLKKHFPEIEVIAGNLATPEAAADLIKAGADALKVGIGPGSMCTTRVITGCGVPQLTAIALCAEIAEGFGVPVIADGGMRTSGDIVKALAAGASSVMLGGMLAGTIETPGEIKKGRKNYRGMASTAAQVSWRGGVPEGMAPEGESTMVSVKGHVRDVILEIAGGIRSGMSYINANSVDEIRLKARFMEMSFQGILESRAHGLR